MMNRPQVTQSCSILLKTQKVNFRKYRSENDIEVNLEQKVRTMSGTHPSYTYTVFII